MNFAPHRFLLRDLPLPPRLVIAAFLISVGIGYFSALVQLHFQHAASGSLLPGSEEALDVYHGKPGTSQLERLLAADESKPFNGGGSMRPAFTNKSAGWKQAVKKLNNSRPGIQMLRAERDGERLALIDWVRTGVSKEDYDQDSHRLGGQLANHPVTEEYLVMGDDGKPVTPRRVRIQSILNDRCARCHSADKGGIPARFPLDTYEDVHVYAERENSGGMSLTKLAQTTHVHLLGFAMLFGMTGLAFAFTSYPGWVRSFLGPFTLIVQVIDIGCWWLARADPVFAQVLLGSGALVAVGLLIQISGTLFDIFGKTGKMVLLLIVIAAVVGVFLLKGRVIDPYLEREGVIPEIRDLNNKLQVHERLPPGKQDAG